MIPKCYHLFFVDGKVDGVFFFFNFCLYFLIFLPLIYFTVYFPTFIIFTFMCNPRAKLSWGTRERPTFRIQLHGGSAISVFQASLYCFTPEHAGWCTARHWCRHFLYDRIWMMTQKRHVSVQTPKENWNLHSKFSECSSPRNGGFFQRWTVIYSHCYFWEMTLPAQIYNKLHFRPHILRFHKRKQMAEARLGFP